MRARWQFTGQERNWLLAGLFGLVIFGVNLEKRTALRHQPMTDLGVFSCASWAAWHEQGTSSRAPRAAALVGVAIASVGRLPGINRNRLVARPGGCPDADGAGDGV